MLIINAGPNEITNLNTQGEYGQNISNWKQQVFKSSQKLYNLVKKCLDDFPSLKRGIIVKRIPRYDTKLNAHLSAYGNSVFDDLWMRNGCPNKILITKQDLECYGELRIQRFGNSNQQNYDGIHMRGSLALQHMTHSFVRMLTTNFPHLRPKTSDNSIF